jgi:transposase
VKYSLRALATRFLTLSDEIAAHDKVLGTITMTAAVACDNPQRIRSEAAFAKLCGACPIPASSGITNRHRLFRGGHRQANAALYRTVIVRMRWHQPTIDYVSRRTAEGLSKKDIIRLLEALRCPRDLSHTHRRPPCMYPRPDDLPATLLTYRGVNALAETINGLYKTEVIRRRGPWRNVDAVEYATLEWVDWFNNRRLLEPIGYVPPAEFEAAYYRLQSQAMAA